jgi:hypothetical protein
MYSCMAYQAHITCFAGGHNLGFESLEGRLGFADSIRRLRVDVEMRQICQAVVAKVCELAMDCVRPDLHTLTRVRTLGAQRACLGWTKS